MTTTKPNSGFPEEQRGSSQSQAGSWLDVVPKSVDSEDALSFSENKAVWEKIYKAIGKATANESERKAVRAGIYAYCAKNATSREGDYAGSIQLADGTTISAAVIPQSAGKMKIRKFLRANMMESYDFFKTTRVMESDDRFVAKCATKGISAENAFATADWLADCPKFTPGEQKAHESSFNIGVDRARRARGGHNLEDVEQGRVQEGLRVQGPLDDDRGSSMVF